MRMVDPFLMELDQETARTKRVLERVPNDKLEDQEGSRARAKRQAAVEAAPKVYVARSARAARGHKSGTGRRAPVPKRI